MVLLEKLPIAGRLPAAKPFGDAPDNGLSSAINLSAVADASDSYIGCGALTERPL